MAIQGYEGDKVVNAAVYERVLRYEEKNKDSVPKRSDRFEGYYRLIRLKWVFIFACLAAMVVVTGYAVTFGDTPIGFWETYSIIWNHILHGSPTDSAAYLKDYIVINLRMPRVVIGIIVGAGLAACGVVMQSALKNPLADPYTTGVSSGAVFGVTVASLLGFSIVSASNYISIFINAFVFSLIPVGIIILISKLRSVSPTTMIMAGISVMYIFNAFTTLVKLYADPTSLSELYQWQVGSLSFVGWPAVPLMLVTTLIGLLLMQMMSKKINVLSTGDENATAMGIDVNSLRRIMLLIVAFVTAVNVGFCGLIGFVGLVAPHIARIFVGADNRYLLPASSVFGGALLITADLIGRVIIYPTVLQVGVVTAFFGGPMFLWLLLRKKSQVW